MKETLTFNRLDNTTWLTFDWVSNDESCWICGDGLREFFDVPKDVECVDVVVSTKPFEQSYEFEACRKSTVLYDRWMRVKLSDGGTCLKAVGHAFYRFIEDFKYIGVKI